MGDGLADALAQRRGEDVVEMLPQGAILAAFPWAKIVEIFPKFSSKFRDFRQAISAAQTAQSAAHLARIQPFLS